MEEVVCSGGCGKGWPLEDIDNCPWELMSMKKAVRCGECTRALIAASSAAGVETVYPELDPRDRGALKKMADRPALKHAPGESSGDLDWESP